MKLIHAADFHLDHPFSALTARQAKERRAEQRALVRDLVSLATREGADLILLAGDLFDGADPYTETVEALASALGSINTPVFIAPGNHDFYSPRSPYATFSWPDNVHIFHSQDITAVPLPALNCVVYGAAFSGSVRDDDPLRGFTAPEDGQLHLMCLHGDALAASRYAPIEVASIAASGLDYLALGHVHARGGPTRAGRTVYAWPGTPEGHGFDECGVRGVLSVTVEPGRVDAAFLPLCRRRYEIVELPIDGFPQNLPADAHDDIYRLLLTGESGRDGLDLAALTALAEPYFYSVQLYDRTVPSRDVWARAGEDNLTGHFLREVRRRMDEADNDDARALLRNALRFGLAALENREEGGL